jgi:YD repeat-containing protein
MMVPRPGHVTASYDYTPAGYSLKPTLRNGVMAHHTHDRARRATKTGSRQSGPSAICSFECTRTAGGKVVEIEREQAGTQYATYFGYDDASRLVSEDWLDEGGSGVYAFTWEYDPAGNWTV